MKNNDRYITVITIQELTLLIRGKVLKAICCWLALVAFFCAARVSAQTNLIWDPNANGGTTSASGDWDVTTANWWNGTADEVWQEISPTVSTNNAVFGGGDGTYTINVDSANVAVSNIFFNNSGYTISGSGIDIQNTCGIVVAPGKTAAITAPIVSLNTQVSIDVGSSSVLNLQGNMNANGASSPFIHAVGTGTVNLGGGSSSPVFEPNNAVEIDCNVNYDSGTWTQGSGGVFYIGYTASYYGVSDNVGAFTVNGGTLNIQGNKIVVCRGGGTGALTLNSGAINFWAAGSGALSANALIAVPNNDTSANQANIYVNGGTFTIGNSSYAAQIQLMGGGSSATEHGILSQSGGTILAYGGIVFGENGGTYSGGTAAVTNSGGSLYLGANGFLLDSGHPATNAITLSGGTIGALANWTSMIPMTLATLNGNITFQCADNNNTPYNISLSGPLTGSGGLNVTGGGTLTLSGTNLYTGSTTVSNGTLALVTSPYGATDGSSMTVDGSAGSPTLSVANSAGQSISTGPLTFQNGSMALSFSFGSLPPSTSVAPIQVSGNVSFSATPTVNVTATGMPVGTYPLITCNGGTILGTPPASVNILSETASGYISQTGNTLYLVVTSSGVANSTEYWRVGGGIWDINTTPDWTKNGSQATYMDGSLVILDDTASGPFPISITNNTIVSPASVTVNNTSGDNYTITGTGSIAGSATITVAGGGTLTLTSANTYAGGTTLSSGQLNINNGGDSSGNDSAIGTGTLTISGGVVDNTSGSNITLVPNIPESWNDSWEFMGSSSLDIGQGTITLNANTVVVTVNTNTLQVDGTISDNGNEYGLTLNGGGVLTLDAQNNFFGDFEIISGQLNIGNAGALGYGTCIIDGGSIDNYSGGPLMLNSGASGSPGVYTWAGSFSYLGTSNSLNLGTGAITVTLPGAMTVTVVSNTFITQGQIAAGNTTVHKSGLGTWDLTGYGANGLGLSIDQGTVLFDKNTGFLINHPSIGLTIQSNALAFETGIGGPTQPQINPVDPVTLSTGGIWDLNGMSETAGSFTNANGILRNSSISGISDFTNNVTASTLTGENCVFDVTNSGAVLNIYTVLDGSGSVIETGSGLVDLEDTNTYTGNTTVKGGTLELNAACLAIASTVAINTNAILNLNFTATNQVGALLLGGTNQPPGTYNATTSPAYMAGTGSLQVVSVTSLTGLAFTGSPVISGTTLTISATNAGAGTVYLLTTTNLLAPVSTWTPVWTNVLSGSGSFITNLLNAVNPAFNQQFYLLSNTNN